MRNFMGEFQSALRNGMQIGNQFAQGAQQRQAQELAQQQAARQQKIDALQQQISQNALQRQQKEDQRKQYLQHANLLFAFEPGQRQGAMTQILQQMGPNADPVLVESFSNLVKMKPKEQDAALLNVIGALNGTGPVTGGSKNANNMLEKIDPNRYTPSSVQQFSETGRFDVLIPKADPTEALKTQETQLQIEALQTQNKLREAEQARTQENEEKARQIESEEAANALKGLNFIMYGDADKPQDLTNPNVQTQVLDRLDKIYGAGEQLYPNVLLSQSSVDMLKRRNSIGSLLELGAAGKLKGQGTITEPERQILREAATIFKDETISPEAALGEIQRIIPIFQRMGGDATVDKYLR